MKKNCLTLLCAAIGYAGTASTFAAVESDPAAVAADALVGRPLCLAVTVAGAAFFIATLPFSAPSGSVGSTADILIVKPGKATFIRPVGDFSYPQPEPEQPAAVRQNKA